MDLTDKESGSDIPAKLDDTNQEEMEIDQREVDSSHNIQPQNLRIDAAKLFTQATEQTRMALCITDPHLEDQPIVYVNEAFTRLTGYDREESVGRNCRFLQGKDTSEAAIAKIREVIGSEEVIVVDILNYKKDGTPFWNALHIGPLFDDEGKLEYYYGSQWDITDLLTEREENEHHHRVTEELQHRTGNLFAMINAIINISARGDPQAKVFAAKVSERVHALGRAHKASLGIGASHIGSINLRGMIEDIIRPYLTEREDRFTLTGEKVSLPRIAITPIGLALHELATNALKYGSLAREKGSVGIDWELSEGELTISWTERGGPSGPAEPVEGEEPGGSGAGNRIMAGVLSELSGSIESTFGDDGLQATIRVPLQD